MDSVNFDAEEPRSDHVPEGAVVSRVRYNGGSETVEYDVPESDADDDLSEMSRAELYRLGEKLGIEFNWSGPEAHGKQEMIEEIAETEGEE